MQNDHPKPQVLHPIAGETVPARAQVRSEGLSAVQLLRRSLDTFLAKDIQGWAELCDADIVVEFPFAPDAGSRRMVGRTAIYEYLKDYPSVIDVRQARTLNILRDRGRQPCDRRVERVRPGDRQWQSL